VRVLDLGSGGGSFAMPGFAVTRVDIDPGGDVQADAAALPFRDAAFAAVVSNHSLEHIARLDEALSEIGRVIAPNGALYVAVPDASTLCDRIYRWAASGGGHVNPFTSAPELAARIERATGLPHRATRVLHTSLSFLNRRNVRGWPGVRWLALGAGSETLLRCWSGLARACDRRFGTRLSVYGWALYFGGIAEGIDTRPWTNVCVRCGAGHADAGLDVRWGRWKCPACGAANFFSRSIY
jgi:SAM-dependent methyltransferase/ribosomal protein S27AE